MDAVSKPLGAVDGCNHIGGLGKTTTLCARTVITVPVYPKTGSSGSASFVWIVSRCFSTLHVSPPALILTP